MSPVKPASVAPARDFFAVELRTVMSKRQITAESGSFEYLVDLLLLYMRSETFFVQRPDGKLENNVLADLYGEYLRGSPEAKQVILKRLGDICMLVTGLFPDSLRRKLVDIDYYFGMGGSAYHQLAQFQFSSLARTLFAELAFKFVPYSNVLGEMSERSGLQSNLDLLRLYERWLLTGNERLRALLSEHGISGAVKVETKTKH